MLPSMSRLNPDRPREPSTMRSHCSSAAVCKIVSVTLPHFKIGTCGTPASAARAVACARSSCPCCSTLSIKSSEDVMTSGVAYTPETFSTVRIHNSACICAARAVAYATAASDHGLPPVATRMRVYMRSPPRLHRADEAIRAIVTPKETLQSLPYPVKQSNSHPSAAHGSQPPPVWRGSLALRSISDFGTGTEDRSGVAGALKFKEPGGTPGSHHGIPKGHRGLASRRRAEHRTKKPWTSSTIEHNQRHADILPGFGHGIRHVSVDDLIPRLIISGSGQRCRQATGAENRLQLCHRADIGLIVVLARTHGRVELAHRLTPILLAHCGSHAQGAQPHEVRDTKALWQVTPFVDLAQTKKAPVHLDGLLAAHVFHPARRDPTPRTYWVPVKLYRIFCVSHVCFL